MQAFKLARELDAGQGMPKVNAASNSEVDRVLKAKTDYDVMQVKPGANVAAVKKRYRAMTLALHPDKCKVRTDLASILQKECSETWTHKC